MKAKYETVTINENFFAIGSVEYPQINRVHCYFSGGLWDVSSPKWADSFEYKTKSAAIKRAKEMIDSCIDDIRYS